MSADSRISAALEAAPILPLNSQSRYFLVSDCHRGCGNGNDNFLKNEFLYLAALNYYFCMNFTYLELGDGDELWENRSIRQIKEAHSQSFEVLSRFYKAGRFYSLYGNHDIVKSRERCCRKHYASYCCTQEVCEYPLLPGITFYPGILLKNSFCGPDIALIHGHQADLLNSTFWPLARFLVRYLWRPLEHLGIPDPTSAAKNHHRKKKSEQILSDWAGAHGLILIAGHTHHPMTGTPSSPYFNTGSCISPGSITGIEIEGNQITLVKWQLAARSDLTLFASRTVLGSESLCNWEPTAHIFE